MPKSRRLLRLALVVGLIGLALGLATIGVLYWLIVPRLPDVQVLRNTEMQVPLTVYSREGGRGWDTHVSEVKGWCPDSGVPIRADLWSDPRHPLFEVKLPPAKPGAYRVSASKAR